MTAAGERPNSRVEIRGQDAQLRKCVRIGNFVPSVGIERFVIGAVQIVGHLVGGQPVHTEGHTGPSSNIAIGRVVRDAWRRRHQRICIPV